MIAVVRPGITSSRTRRMKRGRKQSLINISWACPPLVSRVLAHYSQSPRWR